MRRAKNLKKPEIEDHMKANQTQPNAAEFRPKPLTVEQENVIDLLITGKSERETAEVCGVNRSTIA
jgi:DNA-binding CsgD family transcriptional regulator